MYSTYCEYYPLNSTRGLKWITVELYSRGLSEYLGTTSLKPLARALVQQLWFSNCFYVCLWLCGCFSFTVGRNAWERDLFVIWVSQGFSTISWWFIWFINMKGVEVIHLSSKTWWEEFWTTDDAGISFVSNYSTEFANTLLSHVESWNNCLQICFIIVDGRWRYEIMRAMTWSGQLCWISNNL